KWYLFGAAVSARYAWLAVVAVVMSTVSIYYYLRVVVSMYMTPSGKETAVRIPGLLAMSVAIAVVFTLLLGIYPGRFLELAAQGAAQLQLISWGG
ncbi:MAG: NADH-quinone oxidoreductase subunit N, partial [Acidobacteriota bacterium]